VQVFGVEDQAVHGKPPVVGVPISVAYNAP
jgi:hypothetical protein